MTATQYWTRYIAIGGKADGTLYPLDDAGLAEAMASDADSIRPARRIEDGFDRHDRQAQTGDDLDDIDDYGCVIDRGNSNARVKRGH